MKKTKVYDLPTRVFHWLFAGLFLTAIFIAKVLDDDSPVYPYHMMAGLMLGGIVMLRLIWAVMGTRYAKFTSFDLRPSHLIRYFSHLFRRAGPSPLGHNPASSWSALIMMFLALGLAVSGILMTTGGDKESLEEVHELFGNIFLLVVIAHIGGIVLHSLSHGDSIALSMINGNKASVPGGIGIQKTYASVALIFIALVASFGFYLARNFDTQSQTLSLLGTTLQLGEVEDEH